MKGKSLGNGIDPLEIIDTYGADALRFTLATGNSPLEMTWDSIWKEWKHLETLQIKFTDHLDLYLWTLKTLKERI